MTSMWLGLAPVVTVSTTPPLRGSTTETVASVRLTTSTLPERVSVATDNGPWPVATDLVTRPLRRSTTETSPPVWLAV